SWRTMIGNRLESVVCPDCLSTEAAIAISSAVRGSSGCCAAAAITESDNQSGMVRMMGCIIPARRLARDAAGNRIIDRSETYFLGRRRDRHRVHASTYGSGPQLLARLRAVSRPP